MISNVPEWWSVAFSGCSEQQDDMFIARMEGVDSFFNFTIEDLIPGKRVVLLVADCNMPWYYDQKESTNTGV